MRIWRVQPDCKTEAAKLASALGISIFLASILINKGFNTEELAKNYLHPENTPDYDSFLLPDMDKAVERIKKAIDKKEKIVVYGDYDVDGITATAILVRNFRALGAEAAYFNPSRFKEGYGMKHVETLEQLYDEGAKLIVSVDCGITDGERIEAMKGKLDFVITDHHQPGETLPDAVAVVDAHRSDSKYPYKFLCGAAVAYKLSQALWQFIKGDKNKAIGLELAAVATIADIVPLTGENRRIAFMGLKKAENTKITGLQSLIHAAGYTGKRLTGESVGFGIGPRLNSTGRLKSAKMGVELLLTENQEEADRMAKEINDLNNDRKDIEDKIHDDVARQLAEVDIFHSSALVVHGEGWHEGVIGTLANKLLEKYCRPIFIISVKDGVGVGSARSVDGMHLFKALSEASKIYPDMFLAFGGHAKAAGFSLKEENIEKFTSFMQKYAEENLAPADYIHKDIISLEENPQNVDINMVEELSLLEPCGEANKPPLFACRNVRFSNVRAVGDGKHLQMSLGDYGNGVRGVAFRMGEELNRVRSSVMDMTYDLSINEYNGKRSVQFRVDSLESPVYEGTKRALSVENLRVLYSRIKEIQQLKGPISTAPEIFFKEFPLADFDADADFLSNGVKVLVEAGLLTLSEDKEYYLLGNRLCQKIEDTPHFRLIDNIL